MRSRSNKEDASLQGWEQQRKEVEEERRRRRESNDEKFKEEEEEEGGEVWGRENEGEGKRLERKKHNKEYMIKEIVGEDG